MPQMCRDIPQQLHPLGICAEETAAAVQYLWTLPRLDPKGKTEKVVLDMVLQFRS